jgi:hypothetical protein
MKNKYTIFIKKGRGELARLYMRTSETVMLEEQNDEQGTPATLYIGETVIEFEDEVAMEKEK